MTVFDETSSYFRIKEHTRDEFLGVGTGSGGLGREVLRWSESDAADQLWLVIPRGDDQYQLISAIDNGVPSPCFLTLFPMGDPAGFTVYPSVDKPLPPYFDPGGDPSAFATQFQTFRFRNGDGATFNIQEPTKNEYAGISSPFGRLVRWVWTGEKDQLFTFKPWNPPKPPTLAEPGTIGDVPRIKAEDQVPPETSDPVVIGEVAVPAVLVDDPHYSNKLIQFQRSPYYILRREQFWDRTGDRGYYLRYPGGEKFTRTIALTYKISSETTVSTERTFAIELSVTGGIAFGPVTAGISTKVTNGLNVKRVSHDSVSTEKQETFEVEVTKKCVLVCWSLVDRYSLLRVAGSAIEPVQTWTVPQTNTMTTDSFPPDAVSLTRPDGGGG